MLLLLYCNLSVSSVFQLRRNQGQFYSQNPRLVVCRRLKNCHDTLFRLTEWSTLPFQALTGPIFSYLWNPFPTSYTDFRLGIPRFQVLGPISDSKLHITSWSSRRQLGAPSLDYSATGPPSYDRYGQHCSSFCISTTGRDQSPCPIMSSCGLLFYCFNLTC